MKILNLYAGIGGNRKLWSGHEVVAVEHDPNVAAVYKDFFPDDEVVIGDAHQYLLDHYSEFDFIWSSPPCPTHSRLQTVNHALGRVRYPDMKLYEEIIFLKHWYKGLWCVENVISYYEPLIDAHRIADHYFWSNFLIMPKRSSGGRMHGGTVEKLSEFKGFDLTKYKGIDKRKALRNCVEPETAKHILDCALNPAVQEALL